MGLINLNDTIPAATSGMQNVKWQADNSNPRNVSAQVPVSGGGGGGLTALAFNSTPSPSFLGGSAFFVATTALVVGPGRTLHIRAVLNRVNSSFVLSFGFQAAGGSHGYILNSQPGVGLITYSYNGVTYTGLASVAAPTPAGIFIFDVYLCVEPSVLGVGGQTYGTFGMVPWPNVNGDVTVDMSAGNISVGITTNAFSDIGSVGYEVL